MKHALLIVAVAAAIAVPQAAKTHRLEATPETVAYGYYWSEAKPALRIASGASFSNVRTMPVERSFLLTMGKSFPVMRFNPSRR